MKRMAMHSLMNYVLSLHFAPLGASVLLPCVARYLGASWITCAALSTASLVTCAVVFYFQPILRLAPMGGRYNVGLRELDGDRGAMHPPLSVFYPTTAAAPPQGTDYVPFNDSRYLRGMGEYAGMPYILMKDVALTKTQVRMDATPVPLFCDDGTPRPIALFSHGLAGYPRLYSTLLMDITARGIIAFGMTHTDGSAAYCRDSTPDSHVPLNNTIAWNTAAREPQLDIRVREALNTLARIRSGELLLQLGYEKEDVDRFIATDPQVHLVGHSFGGATALATALQEGEAAKQQHAPSSIASVVVYDPWQVPLQGKMFHDMIADKAAPVHYATPTLQIFSEAWVRDKAHYGFFEKVKPIIAGQPRTTEETAVLDAADKKLKRIGATWYTMKNHAGTGHLTCTDTSLFSPVVYRAGYMTEPPRAAIVDCAHDTVQFIKAIAGSIPIEKDLANDPVLTAFLKGKSIVPERDVQNSTP